jgi:hypothetical protein
LAFDRRFVASKLALIVIPAIGAWKMRQEGREARRETLSGFYLPGFPFLTSRVARSSPGMTATVMLPMLSPLAKPHAEGNARASRKHGE